MSPRRRTLVLRIVLVGAVSAALAAGLLFRADESTTAVAAVVGTVRLEAPVTVVAGEPLTIVAHATDGPVPDLVVTTTATSQRLVPSVSGRTGTFEIPAGATAVSGLLTATPVGHPAATTAVEVLPGEVVDPVTPLVGPRTIVADTADHTMVTVLPVDVLGNPVAAGLPVTVEARRPDGAVETHATETNGMLAWLRVPSGTMAGRTVLGVRLLGARGPAGDVTEVAGPPTDVTLTVEGGVPVADGRSPMTVRTGELRDAFQNLLPDGTHVEILVTGPDGRSSVPAQVVGGRASAVVAAPDRAATLVLEARVRGVAAAPLEVTFGPAVGDLPVVVDGEAGHVVVRVGPVLDPHGGYVADGTPVVAGLPASPDDVGQLVGGMAELVLTDDGQRTVAVTVTGVTATAPVVRR